jgi:hypothetical protein
VPAVPEDVVYGIGRIDASGRVADRAVISALGWRGGDRLTLTADAGVVTARRDPGGMVTLRAARTSRFPPRCAAAAAWSPATGCCWPQCSARAPSSSTVSPSCPRMT